MVFCCEQNVVILKESTLCVRECCSYFGISVLVLVSCWFRRSFEVSNETPHKEVLTLLYQVPEKPHFSLFLKHGYQTSETIVQVQSKDFL